MDKILTKKILGLKVEDILKCVLLVGVGYCIAVMLGNCNCVEGLPFVCRAQTACSRDQCVNDDGTIDLDCEACPGWQLIDPDDGTTQPWITSPSQLYTCESREGSNVGYGSREECIANTPYSLAEGPMGLSRKRGGVPECNAAPPYSPPTPPPPPTPPTPPAPMPPETVWTCQTTYGTNSHDCYEYAVNSKQLPKDRPNYLTEKECRANCSSPPPPTPSVCTYSGDKYTGESQTPGSLNKEWWQDSEDRCNFCDDKISECREDMKNYLKYVDGVEPENLSKAYNGFCLQTIGTSLKGRGDCGRTKLTKRLHKDKDCQTLPGSDVCIDIDNENKPIYIADPANVKDGAKNCKSYRDGDTFANMAWVKDSLDSPCNANCPDEGECPTTTLRHGIPA